MVMSPTYTFTKMHANGNDFILLDGRQQHLSELTKELAQFMAHRQFGIGCDQILLLTPSEQAEAKILIYNADGTPSGACGNGYRCVASYLAQGQTTSVMLEDSQGALLKAEVQANGFVRQRLCTPRFKWSEIPLSQPMETHKIEKSWGPLQNGIAVNLGNPHVVFQVEDLALIDLEVLGPLIEMDPLFPERVNVHAVTLQAPDLVSHRIWERGAGATFSCGTGAGAVAIAMATWGLTTRKIRVEQPGGWIEAEWTASDEIFIGGPTHHVFDGAWKAK